MVFIYQTPGGDQDVSHAERTDSYLSFVSFFLGHSSLLKPFARFMIMQAQYRPLPYARINSFHGPKRQLLGNHAGQAAPAWKVAAYNQVGATSASKGKVAQDQASRIFLSRLPVDVGEKDVEVGACHHLTRYHLNSFFARSCLERRLDR